MLNLNNNAVGIAGSLEELSAAMLKVETRPPSITGILSILTATRSTPDSKHIHRGKKRREQPP